jgi:hypothetical protein
LKNSQGHGEGIGPSIMSVPCTVTEIHRFEHLVGLCSILDIEKPRPLPLKISHVNMPTDLAACADLSFARVLCTLLEIATLTLVTLTMTLKIFQGHGVPIGLSIMFVSCTVTEILRLEYLLCFFDVFP